MRSWNELSMAEKADVMKLAIEGGVYDLDSIKMGYNKFAEGGSKKGEEEGITDEQYLNTMEKVAEENYKNWGYNNSDEALVHALNDNTYDYRGYYNKYPQSAANADTHWTDEFKTVYHPTFSNESIYSGQKSQYNPLGLPGGFWVGEDENASFIPMAWQAINNQYKSGGGIHIKPENRGKFTALKERTGHSATWFKEHGTPAQKKMATFALNARKWKHGDGGNLFETGGPKRQPAQARPATKNRFENVSAEEIEAINNANDDYWRNQQEELDNRTLEQIEQMGAEADKKYRLRRPNGGEADPELQRVNSVVMSALSDAANTTPFTSDEVEEAAKQQVENKLNTWRPIINTADIATNAVGIMSGNPWFLGAAAIPDVFQTIDHAANEGITANDWLSLGFDGLGVLGATNVLRPLKLTYRQRTTNRYGLPIERDQEVQYGKYLDAFSDWGGKAWGIKDGGDDAIDLWNFGKKITPDTQFYFRPFGLAEEVSR